MGKWLPKELKEDKKSGVLDFKLAQENAEAYVHENISKALGRVESSLLTEDRLKYVWSKQAANEMIGQAMALAYATGYLDALQRKQQSKIIT